MIRHCVFKVTKAFAPGRIKPLALPAVKTRLIFASQVSLRDFEYTVTHLSTLDLDKEIVYRRIHSPMSAPTLSCAITNVQDDITNRNWAIDIVKRSLEGFEGEVIVVGSPAVQIFLQTFDIWPAPENCNFDYRSNQNRRATHIVVDIMSPPNFIPNDLNESICRDIINICNVHTWEMEYLFPKETHFVIKLEPGQFRTDVVIAAIDDELLYSYDTPLHAEDSAPLA